jgi:hypothetical protein
MIIEASSESKQGEALENKSVIENATVMSSRSLDIETVIKEDMSATQSEVNLTTVGSDHFPIFCRRQRQIV